MKEKLIANINDTYDNLIRVLTRIPEINEPKPNNNWTVGQVCEHIILSSLIVLETLKGKTEIAEKDRELKDEIIKVVFLDFSQKMTSPDFIQPVQKSYSKEETLSTIQNLKSEILEISKESDLELVCLDFELPDFGQFTVYEWIIFCLCHTQRHTKQIENK
jgi:hypothetical protein